MGDVPDKSNSFETVIAAHDAREEAWRSLAAARAAYDAPLGERHEDADDNWEEAVDQFVRAATAYNAIAARAARKMRLT